VWAFDVTGFALLCLLMVAVAMAFVLLPLLRQHRNPVAGASEVNVAVFRSQKREIEDDFARGVIDATERDAALTELTERVAEEIPEVGLRPSERDERAWPAIAFLAAILPVAAAGLYLALGSFKAIDPSTIPVAQPMAQMGASPAEADAVPHSEAANVPDAKIVEMVDTLAKKMEQNPSDPKGWMLLARSQAALGRLPEAMKAYGKAVALKQDDAQLYADYADVAVMAQQGRFDGKPRELIAKALKLDPSHLKALVLAASAEMKSGNLKGSIPYWEKLQGLVPKGSDDAKQIESILADVRAGRSPMMPAGGSPPATPVPPQGASVAAGAPGVGAPPPASAGGGSATVQGNITLGRDMAARIGANDVLFVFARAKEGPRMPLAVLRMPAKAAEFPKKFELTDGMAMSPGMNLSSFPEVVVEARISKSGNAQLSPGDLTGVSGVVKSTASGVAIVIDKVAP
jgi:cytochrome c-type biogenesis protein CcmH